MRVKREKLAIEEGYELYKCHNGQVTILETPEMFGSFNKIWSPGRKYYEKILDNLFQ